MAKKYYGAVLTDGRTGLFDNWDECQAFVASCPSSAKFKGFHIEDEARDFIRQNTDRPAAPADEPSGTAKPVADASTAIAYTDGSYNPKTKTWGYGVLLYLPGQDTPIELSDCGTENAAARNVTGEIHGAVAAAKAAMNHGVRKLVIRHDYMGISEWAKGNWKRNQELTQWYARVMAAAMKCLDIEFEHVKGHTGEAGNEAVDQLAKRACGVE